MIANQKSTFPGAEKKDDDNFKTALEIMLFDVILSPLQKSSTCFHRRRCMNDVPATRVPVRIGGTVVYESKRKERSYG